MEQLTQLPVSSTKYLTTFAEVNLNSSIDTEDDWYNEEWEMAKIVILSTCPLIFVSGTIGNILTFIVMQRGSLKHSSTCFYMAMLAVADTCKHFSQSVLENIYLPISHLKKSTHQKNYICK